MPLSPRCLLIVAALAGAASGSALAQSSSWGTSYNMGTLAVGVSTPDKVRLSFYCGDSAAAKANPAIQSGPSMEVSLPKAAGLESAKSLELVIDGQATRIPVKAQPDQDAVLLDWQPSQDFDARRMKAVVAGLAKAKAIEIRAGGRTVSLPTQGAAKALGGDPLGCK